MKPFPDLTQPTPVEALRLWRRRHGLTQAQAAQAKGVSRLIYQNWELGRTPCDQRHTFKALTVTEQLLLARWRLGWNMKHAAREYARANGGYRWQNRGGLTRPAYVFLEAGGDWRLVEFYRKKGFTFA